MLSWLGRSRMLAGVLALLMLGACASSANDPSLTPAQRSLRQQNERFNETLATGAVAGAVLGALAGALIGCTGGRGSNCAAGVALGTAAGAAVGGGAGYYIASRNERYTSREQAAQSRLEAAQRESADLARTAALSDQVSRENEAKLNAARQRYAAGQISRAQLDAELRQAKADLDLIQQGVEHSGKVETAMRQDGVGGEANRVATSRQQMQESANRLQSALQRAQSA